MAPVFFPAASSYSSLVSGYWFLSATIILKPFGGLVFGSIGDRWGRRRALLISLYGISATTVLMGLIPPTNQIGVWALILITLAKLIQVFCFSGEYNGAGVYVVEHAKKGSEAFLSSALNAMTLGGSLLACLMGVILTAPGMPNWSWRLAFVFGGLMGFFALFYRKNLLESPVFIESNMGSGSCWELFTRFPRELFAGIWLGGLATVPFSTSMLFINPILMTRGVFTSQELMFFQTLLSVLGVLALLLVGKLADWQSPIRIILIGCGSLCLFSYPFLLAVDTIHWTGIFWGSLGLILIGEMCLGPTHAYLKNLFPVEYRYRGASLSFGLGLSLFGGTTLLIERALYEWTGTFSVIAIWLLFLGCGAWVALQGVATQIPNNSLK